MVRSMYIPAVLHGIEASLLASDGLRKLQSSIHRVVWSRPQPNVWTDGSLVWIECYWCFCLQLDGWSYWVRPCMLCGLVQVSLASEVSLALWPCQVGRANRLLETVSEGSPGHGPIHLLSASASEIGFRWDPVKDGLASCRPGLPLLSNLAGPVQHVKTAILHA